MTIKADIPGGYEAVEVRLPRRGEVALSFDQETGEYFAEVLGWSMSTPMLILRKKRFRADKEGAYYSFTLQDPFHTLDTRDVDADFAYENHAYFETHEEAEEARQACLELLKKRAGE